MMKKLFTAVCILIALNCYASGNDTIPGYVWLKKYNANISVRGSIVFPKGFQIWNWVVEDSVLDVKMFTTPKTNPLGLLYGRDYVIIDDKRNVIKEEEIVLFATKSR